MRPIGAEQSNTSIVFDDALVLKAFRRVEAGDNPELEMLRFLSERDFPHVAELGGWYQYEGELMDATFGVVQRFVPNARDGWELALDELADDPERFVARLRDLGAVIGRMHTVLASDPTDPAFAPEEPSDESLALLTATIDEEIERLFLELPDTEAVAPIAGHAAEVRDRLQLLSHVGARGKLIRTHGDLHLGQTMLGDDGWVVLDFEGEPARPLLERRRKRSPLRDVAGMLRSFAYAASASELQRGDPAPGGLGGARARGLPRRLPRGRRLRPDAPRRGADAHHAVDLRAREGGLRAALRAQQPAGLGGHPGGRHRPPARGAAVSVETDIEAIVQSRPGRSAPAARRASRTTAAWSCAPSARRRPRSLARPEGGEPVELTQRHPAGLFEGEIAGATLPLRYELEVEYAPGESYTMRDPYAFAPTLGEIDLYLAGEGRHEELYEKLGAHVAEIDGATGRGLRRVGAVGALGLGGRRLQLVGRAPAPDALARRVGHLGALHPRRARGLALQVRAARARTATSCCAPTRSPSRPSCRPRRRRSSTARATSGPTTAGWSCASRATGCASRCRSTRSTSAPGG